MGKMYWFRVVMMVGTLALVILTMRNLQTTKPAASPVAKLILGTGDVMKFVLCPTRVSWVETADGLRVEEDGMKWMRSSKGAPKEELDPIAVEKWFGNHCTISGQKTATGQDFKPALRLGYVSGGEKHLERAGSGEYSWEGQHFISPELSEALRELASLPLRAPAGSPSASAGQ